MWAKRTTLEKILLALLGLTLLCLVGALGAWHQELIPWATDYGTVAEWVGAVATALGFAFAVYTLRRNSLDESQRRETFQRMEASRVVVTVEFDGEMSAGNCLEYQILVHNAASSPVREITIHIVYRDLPYRQDKLRPDLGFRQFDVGTLAPGMTSALRLAVYGSDFSPGFSAQLRRAVCFQFRDVHGDIWLYENQELKMLPEESEYKGVLDGQVVLKSKEPGRRG